MQKFTAHFNKLKIKLLTYFKLYNNDSKKLFLLFFHCFAFFPHQ